MSDHNEILNYGLNLSCEFGPNLNQPINQRMLEKFPELQEIDVDKINTLCYAIRDEGHNYIYGILGDIAGKKQKIPASELESGFKDYLRSKYLWISTEN